MPDPSLFTNLGVVGFALFVLWKVYLYIADIMERKDRAHAEEREKIRIEFANERADFRNRIDSRDQAFRELEKHAREHLTTALVEASTVLKQAVVLMTKHTTKKR
jgi:hypothetical protein